MWPETGLISYTLATFLVRKFWIEKAAVYGTLKRMLNIAKL